MNILYIHGFGSRFDSGNLKIKELEALGDVYGINLDYTESFDTIQKQIERVVEIFEIGLVVGTSLGGYWAAKTGSNLGVPFVAINPAIRPNESLLRYVGEGVTHFGEEYVLEDSTVLEYEDFPTEGYGLVLLDMGDEVLDSAETVDVIDGNFSVVCFPGGTHRFDHMSEALEHIESHVVNSELVG